MPIIETLWSRDGGSKYLTRVHLTPRVLGCGLYLHIFHRGDEDAELHDHPWDFWTMPLGRGYVEQIHGDPRLGRFVFVRPWRWTFKPAEGAHRVLQPISGDWPLVTLVWHRRKRRDWGFWVPRPGVPLLYVTQLPLAKAAYWVPWRTYIDAKRGRVPWPAPAALPTEGD